MSPSKKKKSPSDTPKSFEDASSRLEEIVEILEDGELTLENAISLYERTALCQKTTGNNKGKIEGGNPMIWVDGLHVASLLSRRSDTVLDCYLSVQVQYR